MITRKTYEEIVEYLWEMHDVSVSDPIPYNPRNGHSYGYAEMEYLLVALRDLSKVYRDICDESLALYVTERPRGTENFTVRELIDDADWKVSHLRRVVEDTIEWAKED